MAWLKLVGMIPPDEGNAWVSGGIIVEPLRPEYDSDWADGTRRVVWPIVGRLAAAGTRFESLTAGEVLLPGADIGESVYPPMVRIIVDLVDQKGKARRFVAQGIIGASAQGEWNINAPLTGVVVKGMNYGPGSLVETTLDQMRAMNEEGRQLLADTAQLREDALALRAALEHYASLNNMATLEALAQEGADRLYATEGWSAMPTMNGSALELRSAPGGLIQFIPLDNDTIEISSPDGAYTISEVGGEIIARRNA